MKMSVLKPFLRIQQVVATYKNDLFIGISEIVTEKYVIGPIFLQMIPIPVQAQKIYPESRSFLTG